MGAACQKQFQNIPDLSPIYQQQQYQNQLNRMSVNSIKQQHRTVRPNNKQVQIGMINTKLGTYHLANNQYSTVNNYINPNNSMNNRSVYQYQSNNNINSNINNNINNSKINQNNYQSVIVNNAFVDIDRQQLHATKRPSQAIQTVLIGSKQNTKIYAKQKPIQPLDFNFYYSLALPQYHYHTIPVDYAKQYQNLIVCEQEERNGVKYIGEWKDQRTIHGNGVLQSNTSKYIGQFRNGLKHFHGRQIEKYQVYEGMYENGRRKGRGTKYTPQSTQQGQFDEYLKKGRIDYTNGNYYVGELSNNMYNGRGQFYDAQNKAYYNGIYKNNKLNGHGQVKVHDRIVYVGNFKEGQRHGRGQFYWNDNDYYKGEYAMGKKNGFGQLVRGNIKYTGMFRNGQMVDKNKVNNAQFSRLSSMDDQQSIYSLDNDGLPQEWRHKLQRTKQQESQSQIYDMSSRNQAINEQLYKQLQRQQSQNQHLDINQNMRIQDYEQQQQNNQADDQDINQHQQHQLQEQSKRHSIQNDSRKLLPSINPAVNPAVPPPVIQNIQPQKQLQPIKVKTQNQIPVLQALGILIPDKSKQPYIPNTQRYVPISKNYEVISNSSQSADSDPSRPKKHKVRPLQGYTIKDGIDPSQLEKQKISRIKDYDTEKMSKSKTSINIEPEDRSKASNLGQSQRFIKKPTGPAYNITPQPSQEIIPNPNQQSKNLTSSHI